MRWVLIDVDANGSRKTQVKAAGGLVFSPDLAAEFLQWFLELKGVSVDRNLKFANRMAAGEVADGVSGQKEDSAGIAGDSAQLRERVALVGRKPVFQQVDVVGHALSCFRHLNLSSSA